MKMTWVKRSIKEAQLNPERDLTRVDLTYLRRLSEEMSKATKSIEKIPSSLSDFSKVIQPLNTIASKLSDINSTLKEMKSELKKK